MNLTVDQIAFLDSHLLTCMSSVTYGPSDIKIEHLFTRDSFMATCDLSDDPADIDAYLETRFLDGTLWCAGSRDGLKQYGLIKDL